MLTPAKPRVSCVSEGARQLGGDPSHRGTARLSQPVPREADGPRPRLPGQRPALLPAELCLPPACPLLPRLRDLFSLLTVRANQSSLENLEALHLQRKLLCTFGDTFQSISLCFYIPFLNTVGIILYL